MVLLYRTVVEPYNQFKYVANFHILQVFFSLPSSSSSLFFAFRSFVSTDSDGVREFEYVGAYRQ